MVFFVGKGFYSQLFIVRKEEKVQNIEVLYPTKSVLLYISPIKECHVFDFYFIFSFYTLVIL